MHRVCQQKGIATPQALVVWCDNTPRENKNRTVLRCLGWLVGRGKQTCTAVCMHMKGHTHSLLDQLFGILAVQMRYVIEIEDVWSLARTLRQIIARPQFEKWFGKAEVCVCLFLILSANGLNGWMVFALGCRVLCAKTPRQCILGCFCVAKICPTIWHPESNMRLTCPHWAIPWM